MKLDEEQGVVVSKQVVHSGENVTLRPFDVYLDEVHLAEPQLFREDIQRIGGPRDPFGGLAVIET